MSEGPAPAETPTAFLDEREGKLFPAMRWLTPRRLAFFLIFWISVFFAGSLFINNPFAGSAGAANWDLGAGSPNYYWVVMYLHGLNTGLVGLAALVACDFFQLPSLRVRRGIAGGVLIAGVLAPIGALFNTTAPWTSAGLWVQVVAFLALDEILILFLWGLLEVWRSGAPRSRTLPFLTVSLTGVAMLFAALLGHLAGTILGFGDNPSILGWYATQELGVSLNDWASSLIGAHSYLMISAVPAGVLSLVAVRFGYFRLQGRLKQLAQLGLVLACADLVLQMGMALLAGFTTWPGDLPPQVMALPGVPSFLAVNDAVDFGFLIVGGFFLLGALLLGSGRFQGWKLPSTVPIRALPLLMLTVFTVLTTFTEPNDGSDVGPPPLAWLRLFVAFYLTMVVVLVVLLAERLLGERHQLRIGWTATAGSLLMFSGVMVYLSSGLPVGGYIAAAGLLLVGASFASAAWWGLSSGSTESRSDGRPSRAGAFTTLIRGSARGTLASLVALGAVVILVVAAAGTFQSQSGPAAPAPVGSAPVAVEYINSTVEPGSPGGQMAFCPGNFTVMSNTTIVFTFLIYDTNVSQATPEDSLVQGVVNGTEEIIAAPGAAPENVSTLPGAEVSHTFTIAMNGTIVNIPMPAAAAPGEPATVIVSVVFNQTGTFAWYCNPYCEPYRIQPGDGMAGTVTVT